MMARQAGDGSTAAAHVEQVAIGWVLQPRFVRRLIAERRIEFHKVGRYVRISESALGDFIDAGRVEPMAVSEAQHRMRGAA